MTQTIPPPADTTLPLRPATSADLPSSSSTLQDSSLTDIKSLVGQWTEIIEDCLQKLSDSERRRLNAFDRANLATSLTQDFKEWQLPVPITDDVLGQVLPFFEHAKVLVQKLQSSLKLPGQQPQLKSELLDGGGYLVLWNSSISQDAMKRARALLKTMLDHIHTLETTLSSRPLEQCSRPLTDFCIAIVQLWSETIVCFGRHAFSIDALDKKIQSELERARLGMEDATKALHIIAQQISTGDTDSLSAQITDTLTSNNSEPVWMNHPSLRQDLLECRDSDLQSLEAFFSTANRSQGPVLAMIYGIGGVGKTSLALRHYESQRSLPRRSSRYNYGFWINAESPSSIDKSIYDMALALRLPVSSAQDAYLEVMRWLNSKVNHHQWLIVFDNVDVTDPNDEESKKKLEKFQQIKPSGLGHIIVTTRYFFRPAWTRGFQLQKLSSEESLKLFNIYRQMYAPDVDISAENANAQALLQRFDGLPLAIKVAARFICDELGGMVKPFLDEYVALEDVFLESTDGMSAHEKLNTIWEVPFTRLSHPSYANAKKLFGLMCLMDANDIPVQDMFGQDAALDPEYKFLETQAEKVALLSKLRKLGLIEIKSLMADSASVHRVLSAAFRSSGHGLRSEDTMQLAVNTAAILLNHHFPKHEGNHSLFDKWARCSIYMKHVEALIQVFEDSMQKAVTNKPGGLKSSRAMDELMKNCCWYQVESGEAEQALKLLKFATRISLDAESKEYATLCQGYACVNFELNRLKDCESWNKECLRIRQIHLSEEDPDIANCRANLANLYTAIGQYELARKELTLAMKWLSADRQEDLVYIGMRNMMMGRAYLRAENFNLAEGFFKEAEDVLRKVAADFLLLFLAIDQGTLAMACGRTQEAIGYFLPARDKANQDHPTHPISGVLTYKTCLANFHSTPPRYLEARDGLEATIQQARLDYLSGACKLSGQEPRALRLKARVFAQDPEATDEERAQVPELEARALRLKKELLKVNEGMFEKAAVSEDEEYDRLLCGYHR